MDGARWSAMDDDLPFSQRDRTFSRRISLGHTTGSLVGDNYFYSVKTGALGAKRSAIVRRWLFVVSLEAF